MLVEKIVWIDSIYKYSGVNNNFSFSFTQFGLDPQATNISVQLLDATITPSVVTAFFVKDYIKILIDFKTQHNQYSKSLNNYLVCGIISPQSAYKNYYSDKLLYKGPSYRLLSIPLYEVDIRIVDPTNTDLVDSVRAIPLNVLLYLKMTYEV